MLRLTDEVKISIIFTVFATLLLMVTCVLYKISKLREVLDRETTIENTTRGLVTISLPSCRRDSTRSAVSECSVCKREALGHRGTLGRQRCERGVHENVAVPEDSVFTGKLSMGVEYRTKQGTLVITDIIGKELLPWEYKMSVQTHVVVELSSGKDEIVQQLKSDSSVGLHGVCYSPELVFPVDQRFIKEGMLGVSVWCDDGGIDTGTERSSSLVGEGTISLDKVEADEVVNMAAKMFRKVVSSAGEEIVKNWNKIGRNSTGSQLE